VIYHELVQTTKEYMREVTVIEPRWLCQFAPQFYKTAMGGQMSKRKKNERLDTLFDKFAQDQNAWRLSKRRY
jgi:ATP-dependent RNA helicase DHX8/PRP22